MGLGWLWRLYWRSSEDLWELKSFNFLLLLLPRLPRPLIWPQRGGGRTGLWLGAARDLVTVCTHLAPLLRSQGPWSSDAMLGERKRKKEMERERELTQGGQLDVIGAQARRPCSKGLDAAVLSVGLDRPPPSTKAAIERSNRINPGPPWPVQTRAARAVCPSVLAGRWRHTGVDRPEASVELHEKSQCSKGLGP